jgi:predicted nucleic acid-binding protein
LLELARTLHKPYFLARLDASGRRTFFTLLLENATLVQVTKPVPTILQDKADNLVLATALIAHMPYIITGDRELQRLDTFRGVSIVSAREFLEMF